MPLDHDGERLHLPFPAGRQVTGSVKFLRQSRRQAAIPRRVVLIDDSYVARFEIATLGTMVELTIIVITSLVLRVLFPVITVLMPVLGPSRCT